MKTANQQPWIRGFNTIDRAQVRALAQALSKATGISYEKMLERAVKHKCHAVYITDQFIIGMVRSGRNG